METPGHALKTTLRDFAPNVLFAAAFGFAAGCEARALPRRQQNGLILGFGPGLALRVCLGQRPHQGRSPSVRDRYPAGQSPRLTSAAKPYLTWLMTFEAKPLCG